MAPSKEAMEAAQSALPCLCEWPMEGQHTTPCPKVYAPEVAAAMTAYATERIGEMSAMLMQRGDRAITERDAAVARAEAADAKASVCIDHCTEFEMRALAAEERVRVLEAILTQWLHGTDMMRTLVMHDARQATVVEILTKAESEARNALRAAPEPAAHEEAR